MNLKGKKIFITGSSRGIGAGIASHLSHLEAQVTVTYSKSKESAEKLLSDLPGNGHLLLQIDMTNEDSIKNALNTALETWDGQIDGLVNNAGITRDNLLLRLKAQDFDDVYSTNLRGAFLATKYATKAMLKKRSGSIVNISSVIGSIGNPGQSNYSASKGGLEAFSKSCAKEVGQRGIRVNCVAPGFIKTDMTDTLTEEQKQKILDQLFLSRLGSVKDVAESVAFLLSDSSSYITGQTFHVNGGMYMN